MKIEKVSRYPSPSTRREGIKVSFSEHTFVLSCLYLSNSPANSKFGSFLDMNSSGHNFLNVLKYRPVIDRIWVDAVGYG